MCDHHLVGSILVEVSAIVDKTYGVHTRCQVSHVNRQVLSEYQSIPLLGAHQLTGAVVDPHLQELEARTVDPNIELTVVRIRVDEGTSVLE